jgi:hypothetical protein
VLEHRFPRTTADRRAEPATQRRAQAVRVGAAASRRGRLVSLRWVLVHLIEEYARHAGHADLLRERIDGSVGD